MNKTPLDNLEDWLNENYKESNFSVLQMYEGNCTPIYAELLDKKEETYFMMIRNDKMVQVCKGENSNEELLDFIRECNDL